MPEEFPNINVANAEEFLRSTLSPNEDLINYNIVPLTAPGENYGSMMLALTLTVRNTTTKQEYQKKMVGKMPPPNELLQKIFQIDVSFKKEALVYRDVFPLLENFFKEKTTKSLDIFPKQLGIRLSVDPKSTTVTNDGLILQENLKLLGFSTHDRIIGFNLNTAKAVLSTLAQFHATPIALKHHQPEVFKEGVLPVLQYICTSGDETATNHLIDVTLKYCSVNDKCRRNLNRIREVLENGSRNISSVPQQREPFATLVHNDLWTNNVMIKNENGDVKCKLVDFQLIHYGSLASDVLFFLSTSLQTFVLRNNSNDLVSFYFHEFIRFLKELKVDTTPFTWNGFLEELKYVAESREFFHIMPMLKVVNISPSQVKGVEAVEEGSLKNEDDDSDEYKRRVIDVTLLFLENQWI